MFWEERSLTVFFLGGNLREHIYGDVLAKIAHRSALTEESRTRTSLRPNVFGGLAMEKLKTEFTTGSTGCHLTVKVRRLSVVRTCGGNLPVFIDMDSIDWEKSAPLRTEPNSGSKSHEVSRSYDVTMTFRSPDDVQPPLKYVTAADGSQISAGQDLRVVQVRSWCFFFYFGCASNVGCFFGL